MGNRSHLARCPVKKRPRIMGDGNHSLCVRYSCRVFAGYLSECSSHTQEEELTEQGGKSRPRERNVWAGHLWGMVTMTNPPFGISHFCMLKTAAWSKENGGPTRASWLRNCHCYDTQTDLSESLWFISSWMQSPVGWTINPAIIGHWGFY